MGIPKTFGKASAAKVALYLLSLEEIADLAAIFTEIAKQEIRYISNQSK